MDWETNINSLSACTPGYPAASVPAVEVTAEAVAVKKVNALNELNPIEHIKSASSLKKVLSGESEIIVKDLIYLHASSREFNWYLKIAY